MAKKQIDIKIQQKFDKPQFSLEDAVYFSFLGQKQYGYITQTKKTSWGIQYTVQSVGGSRYPCGLQIKGVNTTYQIGLIYFEESKQLGSAECRRRFDSAKANNTFNGVPRDARRSANEVRNGNTPSQPDADTPTRKVDDTIGRRNRSKNDVKSSSNGMPSSNRKKRGNSKDSELTDAIQKQRNFLNGFVKKD